MEEYFKAALKNFTAGAAYGDAIKHLADKDLTIFQISELLTYPASIDVIRDVVWKHYLDNGTIRFEAPTDKNCRKVKIDYVLEYDQYGRSSYRRVEEIVSENPITYVECDFGKRLYKDREGFGRSLGGLSKDDREYILSLPWPIETVYHICNERMERICNYIKDGKV